jgi:hypothetical protein
MVRVTDLREICPFGLRYQIPGGLAHDAWPERAKLGMAPALSVRPAMRQTDPAA